MKKLFSLMMLSLTIYFFINLSEIIDYIGIPIEKENVEIISEEELTDDTTEFNVENQPQKEYQFQGDLFDLMDANGEQVIAMLGTPTRKDPSAYSYEWWIYESKELQYIQLGVENNTVTTIFATGQTLPLTPVQIGDTYETVSELFELNQTVSLSNDTGKYQFKLNPNELRQTPLVKLSDELFVQFYFDTFNNQLSSIRLLSDEALLQTRTYAIEYWGSLPEPKELSQTEWDDVQLAREKQIFAITNLIRQRFNLNPLAWDEVVSDVAFLHSQDMSLNEYFSHTSLNGDGLKERLGKQNVKYLSAGENIAAMYPDAPAAVEGWFNSEGHRKALLNQNFTHIGIGVFKDHYTQNFLQKF